MKTKLIRESKPFTWFHERIGKKIIRDTFYNLPEEEVLIKDKDDAWRLYETNRTWGSPVTPLNYEDFKKKKD